MLGQYTDIHVVAQVISIDKRTPSSRTATDSAVEHYHHNESVCVQVYKCMQIRYVSCTCV